MNNTNDEDFGKIVLCALIDRHFPLGENDSFRYNSSFYQTLK